MSWKHRALPSAPDLACACVDLARKDAIATVRAKAVDAMWTGNAPKPEKEWRDLMLDIVNELRGL